MLTLSHCFLCLQVLPPCIFLNHTYPACFLLHILSAPVPKFLLFPFHFTICTIAQLFPALILVFFQTWPPHFLLIHFWLLFISIKVFLSTFYPSTPIFIAQFFHFASKTYGAFIFSDVCKGFFNTWIIEVSDCISISGLNRNIPRYLNVLIYMIKLLNTGMILTVPLSSPPRNTVG